MGRFYPLYSLYDITHNSLSHITRCVLLGCSFVSKALSTQYEFDKTTYSQLSNIDYNVIAQLPSIQIVSQEFHHNLNEIGSPLLYLSQITPFCWLFLNSYDAINATFRA